MMTSFCTESVASLEWVTALLAMVVEMDGSDEKSVVAVPVTSPVS